MKAPGGSTGLKAPAAALLLMLVADNGMIGQRRLRDAVPLRRVAGMPA
jgi:hypothetical protein